MRPSKLTQRLLLSLWVYMYAVLLYVFGLLQRMEGRGMANSKGPQRQPSPNMEQFT